MQSKQQLLDLRRVPILFSANTAAAQTWDVQNSSRRLISKPKDPDHSSRFLSLPPPARSTLTCWELEADQGCDAPSVPLHGLHLLLEQDHHHHLMLTDDQEALMLKVFAKAKMTIILYDW